MPHESVVARLLRLTNTEHPPTSITVSFDDWLELRADGDAYTHLAGNPRDGWTFNNVRLVLPR